MKHKKSKTNIVVQASRPSTPKEKSIVKQAHFFLRGSLLLSSSVDARLTAPVEYRERFTTAAVGRPCRLRRGGVADAANRLVTSVECRGDTRRLRKPRYRTLCGSAGAGELSANFIVDGAGKRQWYVLPFFPLQILNLEVDSY